MLKAQGGSISRGKSTNIININSLDENKSAI